MIAPKELEKKGRLSIIPEFNTEFSIGYVNKDGSKTLYVFTAPIKYNKNLV